MLPENVANIAPLIQSFDLSQRSQYSTHIHGGILDLVFDSSNSNIASVLPSPDSHHFVLFSKSEGNICTVSMTHITLPIIITMVILSEIELVKNSENLKYFFFFSVYTCCIAVHS